MTHTARHGRRAAAPALPAGAPATPEAGAPAATGRFTASSTVLLVVLALAWGSSFLFIKSALQSGLDPMTLVFLRTSIAAIAMWLLVGGQRLFKGPSAVSAEVEKPPSLLDRVVLGLLNLAPMALVAWGELYVQSGVAGIINASDPLWTALLLSALARRFDRNARKWVGIGLGFGGVMVVMAAQSAKFEIHGALGGMVAVLMSAALYSALGVFVSLRMTGRSPLWVTASGLTWAAILSAPMAIPHLIGESVSMRALIDVTALALVGGAIGFTLFYILIRDVGPTRAALVVYLMPIVAVVLGALALSESLTLPIIGSLVLVVAGIWIVNSADDSLEREVIRGYAVGDSMAEDPATIATMPPASATPSSAPVELPTPAAAPAVAAPPAPSVLTPAAITDVLPAAAFSPIPAPMTARADFDELPAHVFARPVPPAAHPVTALLGFLELPADVVAAPPIDELPDVIFAPTLPAAAFVPIEPPHAGHAAAVAAHAELEPVSDSAPALDPRIAELIDHVRTTCSSRLEALARNLDMTLEEYDLAVQVEAAAERRLVADLVAGALTPELPAQASTPLALSAQRTLAAVSARRHSPDNAEPPHLAPAAQPAKIDVPEASYRRAA